MQPARCTGVILAGGTGSRFGGRPKGLEVIGGRRIIDRVADALWPAVDDRLLAANDPDARDWLPGVRVAGDSRRERASLVGVETALDATRSAVLIVGWDMPFVTTALLSAIRRRGEERRGAAIPRHGATVEPLCAYLPAAALGVVRRLLGQGELRLSRLAAELPAVVYLDEEELRPFGDVETLFFNVNTPRELQRARALADSGS